MSVIRFDPNRPVEVALKFSEGLRVKSEKFPDSPEKVMYTVCGGDKIYVPLSVEEQLKQLGVKRMELISICKWVVNKSTRWEVKRVTEAPVPETPPELQREVDRVMAQRVSQAPAGPSQHDSGAMGQPSQMPQSDNNADVSHTAVSQLMASSLIAAIDAAQTAEKYAKSRYMHLEFLPDDLCRLGQTIFVEVMKRNPMLASGAVRIGGAVWKQ